jgi:hypothetical protein
MRKPGTKDPHWCDRKFTNEFLLDNLLSEKLDVVVAAVVFSSSASAS